MATSISTSSSPVSSSSTKSSSSSSSKPTTVRDTSSTASSPSSSLSSQYCRLAPGPSSTTASSTAHVLEHRSILQHVGKNHKPDFGTSNIDVLQLSNTPIPVGDGDTCHLAV